jgi:polysaccharide chain length determinant protein (PEP-CTERM system associated)
MTPQILHVLDEIRGAWRFRWIALACSFVIALIGWAIVFALPDRYAAEARVFVDTRTALKPALQGLTIDQSVDAQINYVRQSLLEGPQLEQIATETGVVPAPGTVDERTRATILGIFSNRIVLTAVSAGNQGDDRNTAGMVYGFQYMDPDRDRALKVVDALLNTFVRETLGGKRESSEQAQKFLQAQIKDYEQRLSLAEEKLANFKKRNVGMMPSDQGGYFSQLQKETDDMKKADTELSIAVSRRDELSRQLHGDSVVSTAGAGTNGVAGSGSDSLSRIQEMQAKLDELLLKYTDQHPDVIAARATLAELKQRRTLELESLRRGDASAVATSGAGKNPVYQSMQLELNKVDVEIAALRRELAQHQATVADLRQHLNSAPQVEAEFQQLNRDYDVNKAQYTALLESYQKARLGERADNAGSVRFEVVLPASAPPQPTWPHRMALLASIWLGSLVAGAAAAYGLHMLKPIVSSVHAVNAMTEFPVLGVVGLAFPKRARKIFWGRAVRFGVASIALFAIFVLILVLNVSGARLTIPAIQALVKI